MRALAAGFGLAICGALSLPAQIFVAATGSDAGAGTAASPFLTINHAADVAAPGSTIMVLAGLYGDEQGIVQLGTKDLVIQGAGVGATVLVPHSSSTLLLPSADPTVIPAVAYRVGIVFAGAARVHLRDVTIDALGVAPASGQLAGLYLLGGVDVVCDHIAIANCRAATPGQGLQHAIVVHGDTPADPTTIVVRDGAISGFGSGGLRASLRAEVDLQECRVTGLGADVVGFDQVGVWLEASSLGLVRMSRLTDCGGIGGTAVRLENHASGCVVEGNRISRCAIGVDLRHSPPAIVPGEVRGNRIAAVDTTVRVQGVVGLTINGNSLFPVSRLGSAPYSDDATSGNVWSHNRYAVPPGTANVAIPGGASVDSSPIASGSELQGLERIAVGGAPIAVVSADFDGDGHADFATLDLTPTGVGLTIARWRATGYLINSSPFGGSTLRPVALVAGNFDGAPGTDLIALTAPTPPATVGAAFWVFGNDGAGGLSLLHQENLPGYLSPSSIAAARLDANLVDDVVVTDLGSWPFTGGRSDVFLNGGNGTSWTTTAVGVPLFEAVTAAATGDIDNDGNADIALLEGSPGNGLLHVLRGNGLGAFTAISGSPFNTPPNPSGVLIADYDADGDRDVLVTASDGSLPLQPGRLQIFENRPGYLFASAPQPIEAGPTRMVVSDLDDDSAFGNPRPELLVLHGPAGTISLLGAHEPLTGYAGGGAITLVDGPVDLAATDLDGDPYRDLVVAEPSHGGVALLHGSPTAQVFTYGRGCPGTAGREPRLQTGGSPGLPTQPNVTLQIQLVDAFPFTVAAVAIAPGVNPFAVPCGYVLDAPILLLTVGTDFAGRGTLNLPLPSLPDAHGLLLCFQAGVFDFGATTSFLPSFSLTSGLCLRIGD